MSATVEQAALVAAAANSARDLQNRPGNDLTPTALAAYAEALAGEIDGLSAESEGREGILARGMGAFAAVAQGSYEEPALITLRYEGPGASGPLLGFVGKAVTFDSGGISIKPSAKMHEMKFDMSGGAAVLEAVGAIARLELPVRVVGVNDVWLELLDDAREPPRSRQVHLGSWRERDQVEPFFCTLTEFPARMRDEHGSMAKRTQSHHRR